METDDNKTVAWLNEDRYGIVKETYCDVEGRPFTHKALNTMFFITPKL
jgi:hypothetical protein